MTAPKLTKPASIQIKQEIGSVYLSPGEYITVYLRETRIDKFPDHGGLRQVELHVDVDGTPRVCVQKGNEPDIGTFNEIYEGNIDAMLKDGAK